MMALSLKQLQLIMPGANGKSVLFLNPLNTAMAEFHIDTKLRVAAFLASVAHESGQLRYMRELADGSAYEMRKDLGNVWPGDGPRYKGRGPIQVTGRANYAACGSCLGVDFLSHPELMEIPENACRSSGWYWQVNNLNRWADAGDFDGVSDMINRGHKTQAVGDSNGWPDRLEFYTTALKVL